MFCDAGVFAQSAMVQMDLPATGNLYGLRFVCLLRKICSALRWLAGMAVLIKESTYYVCLFAALVVYGRLRCWIAAKPLALSTILRLWPTTIPASRCFCGCLCIGGLPGR